MAERARGRKKDSLNAVERALGSERLQLLMLLVFAALLGVLFFKGMSIYGDDVAYADFVQEVLSGTFAVNINIFSIRILGTAPVALFVKLFGFTDIGAGAYAYLSYIGTVIAIFLIGKEVYGHRAGLLSALLFSMYPITLKYGTTLEPMTPLVLFLSFAVLAFIMGRKRGSAYYFWACGALSFLATLTNPLAYVYVLFFGVCFLYLVLKEFIAGKREGSLSALGFYLLGFLTVVALLGLLNLKLAAGNPFVEFELTNYYYSGTGGPDQIFYTNPSLTYYIGNYFPYGLLGRIVYPAITLDINTAAQNLKELAAGAFSMNTTSMNEVGFFSYFEVLAFAYLILKRDRKSYFVLLWSAFVLAYMEFGTMSLSSYVPIYKLMRFTIIAAVPLALVLGIGLARFIEGGGERKRHRIARMAAASLIVAFLFASSLHLDYWYYLYNHNSMEYVKLAATYLSSVQNLGSSRVYGPALEPFYLDYYLGYARPAAINEYDNGAYGGMFLPACSDIPSGSYLIIPNQRDIGTINSYNLWVINESWAFNPGICNLRLVADIYNDSSVKGLSILDPSLAGNVYYRS